ncbi:MAG: hypothetical protein ACLFS3_01985 [Candidatus Aenigmatarchaeota archaeon]
MILEFLIPVIIGAGALYLGSKVFNIRIPSFKILIIAVLAEILMTYVLGYVLPVFSFLPMASVILKILIWVGLVNFVVPETSIMEAVELGVLGFAVTYFSSISGVTTMIIGLFS